MKLRFAIIFAVLSLTCMVATPFLYSQEEQNDIEEMKKKAPKVFLDGRRIDRNYIRTEIPFVNYVRDRKEADVHVLITTQTTGSGGREYTIAFIGQKECLGINNTLIYASNNTDTSEEIRRGYVQVLKMGLISYVARSPICNQIGISFKEEVNLTSVEDKWNFWVYSLSLRGRLNGEASRSSSSISGNLSVNRVTPESKLRMGISGNFDQRNYTSDDEKYTSSSESKSFSGLFAKSLNGHWSIGAFLNLSSSSYRNIKFSINPAPAIEYNLFPYSESTRRQLRFLYKLGYNFSRYRELTVYNKTSEGLFGQSLAVTMEIREPWGTVEASLEGSHYFHDFSKNRFEFDLELSFRVLKGLSFNIQGGYERIHDQLALVKGEATLEEILLRRKELATEYEYSLSVGLSFTFGSIYSNVVNPRFGGGGGDRWRRFR